MRGTGGLDARGGLRPGVAREKRRITREGARQVNGCTRIMYVCIYLSLCLSLSLSKVLPRASPRWRLLLRPLQDFCAARRGTLARVMAPVLSTAAFSSNK